LANNVSTVRATANGIKPNTVVMAVNKTGRKRKPPTCCCVLIAFKDKRARSCLIQKNYGLVLLMKVLCSYIKKGAPNTF